MARATRRARRSSPYSLSTRTSSSSAAPLTRSPADGPLHDIRMSSGPLLEKLKPRSAESSCRDEQPRSARIAATGGLPSEWSTAGSSAKAL